ncbi:MAG: paraquat-inducible protein A [Desulfobacteraceae bacterium]|nr:paraquat-inducible protein A [Desulfobacteraceae bacterium]
MTAARYGLVGCHDCRQVSRPRPDGDQNKHACPRCSASLHPRKPASIAKTWALVLAAAILYIPANVLPVTRTTHLGSSQTDTIMSGVIYFITSGSWHIALIIFVASIVIPALKLVVLSFLLISIHWRWQWRPEERTRLYRLIAAIGRWSMVDIFVMSIMVGLLKLGLIASIEARQGIFFFGAVVVLTLLATESFDPRLIWDRMEDR